MTVFFDPADYLERDPETAGSAAEERRLQRRAERRARLCEAMTQITAERGFEAATAQQVLLRAEIGSGTFYKLYEGREACLLEAFERCADAVLARVVDAVAKGHGDLNSRLEAGLGTLIDLLDAHPDVARLLLVEILAGDLRCREVRQRWLGRFAGLLACDRGAKGVPQRGTLAWLAAGALASTLAGELERGEARPRAALLGELVRVGSWPQRGAVIEASMRVEAAADDEGYELVEAAAQRRRKAHRIRAKRHQREQIVAAMTETVGTKGYKAARVKDIVERAGLSTPLFYTHFNSKEDCLLAAFDAAVASILELVQAAVANPTTSAGRAEAGLRALVESLTEQPAVARLVTIEIRRVGARGDERYGEALARFARVIAEAGTDRQAGTASDVPRLVAATVVGMIAREVGEGRAAQLHALLPELVFAVLAPCMGGERAAEEMQRVSR